MTKGAIATALAIVFSLLAATVCYQLLQKHAGQSTAGWFEAGCSEASGGADCAAVLQSPYAYLPPKHPGEGPGKAHIPSAFLGLVYYSMLAVWLMGVGRPSITRRWLHLAPMGLTALGLSGSFVFLYIMFTKLDEWCPWCVVTHGLNAAIALCLVLMWRWVDVGTSGSGSAPQQEPTEHSDQQDGAATVLPTPSPSGRLVFITALAVVSVMFGESQMLGNVNLAARANSAAVGFDQCMAAMDEVGGDPKALFRAFMQSPFKQVQVRADDPVRNAEQLSDAAFEVIVFSDFECRGCKRVAKFLEEEVSPLFDGDLKILYKHFPLNSDCNPVATTKMHKHACDGARLAEGARTIGGNSAFWKAHDYLFANQNQLKQGMITVEHIAKAANVDVEKLRSAIDSADIATRIMEDAKQGRELGLTGTPMVFLAGRPVRKIARFSIRFWDRLAKQYWVKNRKVKRPEHTVLQREAVIRGIQGRKAAP